MPPRSYGTAPGRVEPFAVAALVTAITGVFFCLIGEIVGIVFGHIARSRIKQSGDGGAGFALAALIIGYVEVALIVAGLGVWALVYSISSTDASPTARALAREIQLVAGSAAASPRSGDVVREATRFKGLGDGEVRVGATNELAVRATDRELAAAGWALEVHHGIRARACFVVPEDREEPVRIEPGPCR